MNIKEMIAKTGIVLIGICKGLNIYTAKSGSKYYSVDMEIEGCPNAVNVKLPDDYPLNKIPEWELLKLPVVVKPSFDRKSNDIWAVTPA